MKIRPIEISDAEQFLSLINTTDAETPFLLYEAGERKTTVKEQADIIKKGIKEGTLVFVLEDAEHLLGFVYGGVFSVNRRRHCMHVAIAILQDFTGQGWGTKLMEKLESAAVKQGISRLELSVSVNNKKAIALYQKLGFELEGKRKGSFLIDGALEDDYMMAKIISIHK